MPYIAPAIPDFKAQFVRDFPYAVPLTGPGGGSGAVVAATNNGPNNAINSLTVTAPGANYPKVPDIIIYGGGGVGALAQAVLTSKALTGATLLAGGYGYTLLSAVTVYISNGLGDNSKVKEAVTDYDIVSAFGAALDFNMTQSLWGSQSAYTRAVNLLAAHYLCLNVQAGGTGLGGKAEWLTQAKTVGNVTESYNIPDRIMRSPFLAKLSKTTYGAQFLELVSPLLIGNYGAFPRRTLP